MGLYEPLGNGSPFSTLRAVEICLSRLRLSRQSGEELAHHRSHLLRREPSPPTQSVDELRATMVAIVDLSRADSSYSKQAMLDRFAAIREEVAMALGERD